MSSAEPPDNMFPILQEGERIAGLSWYCCLYALALTLSRDVRVWVQDETTAGGSAIAIGWGAKNVDAPLIADRTQAPAGVEFVAPSSYQTAPAGVDMEPSDRRALWLRYTVTPATGFTPADRCSIGIGEGDGAEFIRTIGLPVWPYILQPFRPLGMPL